MLVILFYQDSHHQCVPNGYNNVTRITPTPRAWCILWFRLPTPKVEGVFIHFAFSLLYNMSSVRPTNLTGADADNHVA